MHGTQYNVSMQTLGGTLFFMSKQIQTQRTSIQLNHLIQPFFSTIKRLCQVFLVPLVFRWKLSLGTVWVNMKTIQWYPCCCDPDWSWNKFKNTLCLRPFNSVDSETRPKPSKSGLETKTDLEYNSTISRWLDEPSKAIAVCQGITSTKQINSRRVLSPAEPVGKSNSYQGQERSKNVDSLKWHFLFFFFLRSSFNENSPEQTETGNSGHHRCL